LTWPSPRTAHPAYAHLHSFFFHPALDLTCPDQPGHSITLTTLTGPLPASRGPPTHPAHPAHTRTAPLSTDLFQAQRHIRLPRRLPTASITTPDTDCSIIMSLSALCPAHHVGVTGTSTDVSPSLHPPGARFRRNHCPAAAHCLPSLAPPNKDTTKIHQKIKKARAVFRRAGHMQAPREQRIRFRIHCLLRVARPSIARSRTTLAARTPIAAPRLHRATRCLEHPNVLSLNETRASPSYMIHSPHAVQDTPVV
jgi:hypothetical protein